MKNGTILQAFHWYLPADGQFWNRLKADAKRLAKMGITAIWLPPAGKGTEGKDSIGYDVYDIYDLGEFNQKGSVRTKYGTKDELVAAVEALHAEKIMIYVDVVLNHMGGADEKERVLVRQVNPDDRNEFTSDPFEIEAYTKFTFPGRAGKYSQFIWDYHCFTGVDYADDLEENGIFSIVNNPYGEGWEPVLDDEKGNYDYLMYDDIEFRNPAVREELLRWGKWLHAVLNFEGVRMDAIKHMSPEFITYWLDGMRAEAQKDMFAVGEYWSPGNLPLLVKYLEVTEEKLSLFDACLQNNFHRASRAGKDFPLNTIFDETLVGVRADKAVTVVSNHDTQPLQSLEAPVEPWFKPLAYALILLREQGYPCVFYPDLYSAQYTDKGQDGKDYDIFMPVVPKLEKLITARQLFGYGEQHDYIDHVSCIGWTRGGDDTHPPCAVVLTNDQEGFKDMELGEAHAGKKFKDYLENHPGEVVLDEHGKGRFSVSAGSVSVWVPA